MVAPHAFGGACRRYCGLVTPATLFQQSALAIGLGLAYTLVVEVLIFGLLGGLGGDIVKQIQQWFPVANTGYLVDSFGSLRVRGVPATTPYTSATHAVILLRLYLAAFTAISAWLSGIKTSRPKTPACGFHALNTRKSSQSDGNKSSPPTPVTTRNVSNPH